MQRKISGKKKQLIKQLHSKGLNPAEIARKTNVPYMSTWLYLRGFESFREYKEDLAKQRGHESRGSYEGYLARQRQKGQKNKELSDLIKRRLEELERNQSWLSGRMGVSRETVSKYFHGEIIPNKERLGDLYMALGLYDLLEVEIINFKPAHKL